MTPQDEALLKEAEAGAPWPLCQRGLWRLIGQPVEQDIDGGRADIERAAQTGLPEGLLLSATIAVMPAFGQPDWEKAATRLRDAAMLDDGRAHRQLAFLLPAQMSALQKRLFRRAALWGDVTSQSFLAQLLMRSASPAEKKEAGFWAAAARKAGDPSAPTAEARDQPRFEPENFDLREVMSHLEWPHNRPAPERRDPGPVPLIAHFKGVFTRNECLYVMSRGAAVMQPADVHTKEGGLTTSALRTNRHMMFGVIESDVVVQSLDARLCQVAGLEAPNTERFSLLHYRPGEQYAPHFDFFDRDAPGQASEIARHGQRIQTCLCYLNEGFTGGETEFPQLGIKFKGTLGDALLFSNVDAQGREEKRAEHAGLPPKTGAKWMLTKWVRDRAQTTNWGAPPPG